jgi:flagellar biosynthesis/type III secretory pathway chaperone
MEKEKLLENLYLVLNEEYKLYRYIYKVSNTKKKVIIDGKIKELEEISKVESQFVVKVKKLETYREKIVETLIKKLGINADKINIQNILDFLDDSEMKLKLRKLRDDTINVINELKNINEINSKLIKNSLDYVDFSINILSSTEETNNNYGNKGSINTAKKRIYFDKKL